MLVIFRNLLCPHETLFLNVRCKIKNANRVINSNVPSPLSELCMPTRQRQRKHAVAAPRGAFVPQNISCPPICSPKIIINVLQLEQILMISAQNCTLHAFFHFHPPFPCEKFLMLVSLLKTYTSITNAKSVKHYIQQIYIQPSLHKTQKRCQHCLKRRNQM